MGIQVSYLPAQAFCPYMQSFFEVNPLHQRLVNKFPELRRMGRLLPGTGIYPCKFGPEDGFQLPVYVEHQHFHLQPGVTPGDQARLDAHGFVIGRRTEIADLMLGNDKGLTRYRRRGASFPSLNYLYWSCKFKDYPEYG